MATPKPDWSKWPSEWHAAVGLVAGMLLMAPYGRLAPWLEGEPELLFFMPFGLVVVFYGFVNLVLALTSRRPRVVSLASLVSSVAIGLFHFWPSSVEASWRARFEHDLPLMKGAIQLLKQSKAAEDETYRLPERYSSLTGFRRAIAYEDSTGKTWYSFPIVTYGIDNSLGFSWSESGLPPPAEALHQIPAPSP